HPVGAEMADIVAQLAPSADQRRSSVIGDGKGLDYPLRAAPVANLIGDPYLAHSADRVADRRRQIGLCSNRRAALRDINVQRHLTSRPTLRIFRAEAASHWKDAVTSA